MLTQFKQSVEYIKSRTNVEPTIGIILGTGLGGLVKEINVIDEIPYQDIPNFPVSTVESHSGKLIFGELGGKKVVAMQGRFHYYEGYSMEQVVMPVRVMKMLGVKFLLLSNASGSLNPDFKKGELMMIDDHINMQPENPLRGQNLDELGPRFPDMSEPYSAVLNQKLQDIAKSEGIALHKGVYVSVPGPNLETRAEYKFLRTIGADAVGMSTVPEVIACNHMGLPCCCVCVLTDECDPNNLKKVSIEEIIGIAKDAEPKLTLLYQKLIEQL